MPSLHTTKDVIRDNGNLENVQDLVDAIEKRLAPADHDVAPIPYTSWQIHARQCVQAIIVPDEVAWMEADDESLGRKFAERALDDIKNRFTR